MQVLRCVLVAIWLSPLRSLEPHSTSERARPEPVDPVPVLLSAFDRRPLVGIGESHRLRAQHDVILDVIRHPSFPVKAGVVVVEFGNARFQDVADRFVGWRAGALPPSDSVDMIWESTTQIGVWDAPMYRRFFEELRTINSARAAASQRTRVLLADPPIDWAVLTSGHAVRAWFDTNSRNEFAAQLIEREVLARNGRALIIAGAGHLIRPSAAVRRELPEGGPNETGFLEHRRPGSMFVVGIHDAGMDERLPAIRALFAGSPVPSIVLLAGTSLGQLRDGNRDPLEDQWDAYLYVGSGQALQPEATAPLSPARLAELRRRERLMIDAGLIETRP